MRSGSYRAGDGMHVVDGCLIVSVSREPDEEELHLLRRRMLARMEQTAVRGVLLDVSQVMALDSVLFGLLAGAARVSRLMGKTAVFVGFQAGIASSLVDLDLDTDEIETALTMEDGLEMLLRRPDSRDDEPPGEDEDQMEVDANADQAGNDVGGSDHS